MIQSVPLTNIRHGLLVLMVACLGSLERSSTAEEPPRPIPTALLPFENRGEAKEEASILGDLLFAKLVVSDHLLLVERQALKSVLDELKLSKAGVVKADEANQVGKLTGAKLLITGSVLRIKGDLYIIAKVIGTETSRLAGASVQGPSNANFDELVGKLAAELDQVIASRGESLLPKVVTTEDWIVSTKKILSGKALPSVTVKITERHLNQATFDPAAQTECEQMLTALGFKVIDGASPRSDEADYRIQGEAFSQFAANHSDLISVRCRVEAKMISQKDGNVLSSDSETTIAIDLAEQIAAKVGLQEGTRKLIERFVLKLSKELVN